MTQRSVLVVDDEVFIRLDLAQRLEDAGYLVLEASDADEAIVVLEENPEIQLVFTDVQMPGTMDGMQLAHYVRKRWPPTAIVICSGNTPPAKDALPSDAYWLAKPFDDLTMGTALDSAKRWLTR